MGNHGEAASSGYLDPWIEYMRGALSRCGHEVTVVWNAVRPEAVNLLFEFFLDPGLVENIVSVRRSSSIKFGVVATELIVGSSIPYAKYSMLLDDDMIRARIQGFESLSRSVDFVWSWLQRTADETRRHNLVSEFFPVGHVAEVPARLRRSPKDIDLLFFGMRTLHRDHILDLLRSRGLNVTCVGRGFPAGYRSRRMLESLIDRAKIGLNLNLHAGRDPDCVVDPRFASCIRIVDMLERDTCVVSEDIPLDNPYAGYMQSAHPEALADTCLELLSKQQWRAAGQAAARRFRAEMDVTRICGPVVQRTLACID
jgi:hypothetical protein